MIGYLRVPTEEQANSGLWLEAQRDTIQRYADAHGWDVVWYVDEGLSAKSLSRQQLQDALAKRQGRHMGRISALPASAAARQLALRRTRTLAGTAAQLNAEGFATATGAEWSANSVANTQARLSSTVAA